MQSSRTMWTRSAGREAVDRAVASSCAAGPSRLAHAARCLHASAIAQEDQAEAALSNRAATSTPPPSSSPAPRRATLTPQQRSEIEAEEEWKRNLRQVKEWRRNQAELRTSLAAVRAPSYTSMHPGTSTSSRTTTSSASSHLLSALVASGAELGHHPARLYPSYLPYIHGTRAGVSIIDLEQTVPLLRRAANFVREVVEADGVVLVVGTREGHRAMVKKAAGRLEGNGFGVAGEKWMAGTLTNSFSYFGLNPIKSRAHLPDVAIFLNPSENLGAIRECTASRVPTIGIVDTDTDPRIVTYAIPANMESLRTAELVVSTLSLAGKAGREKRLTREMATLRGRR